MAAKDLRLAHALQVAAVRATGKGKGVASHYSAARIHGLDLLTQPSNAAVTLTVPRGARTGRREQSDVIRHGADLPDRHVTELLGIPVTTGARTVADIARTSSFMEGVVVADSALRNRDASKTGIRRVLADCAGWPGIERARRVADFAAGLSESVLESCARVFFHEHALPRPDLQAHILGADGGVIARVDFCWDGYRTIAEADGNLKYQAQDDMVRHLRRDRLLQEAGWDVVHFGWQELFSDPARVVARIRDMFGRAVRSGVEGYRT